MAELRSAGRPADRSRPPPIRGGSSRPWIRASGAARGLRPTVLLPFLLQLAALLARTQAFVPPGAPAPATASRRPSDCDCGGGSRALRTRLYSDVFFNFEGLKRKLNLTHFSDPALDQAPSLPEEDFSARPDLIKAQEIGRALRAELDPQVHLASVSLYFHVAHHHLQSYREALEAFVAEQEAQHGGRDEVRWEAFQLVGLPAALEETRYPGAQAGRVPSRSRLLLCGTFRDAAAEERAKDDMGAWRKALVERLKGYRLLTGAEAEAEADAGKKELVETMPPSQAVYRRLLPEGPAIGPRAPPSAASLFLMGFLQSSWSSERKIRNHLERLRQYVGDVREQGLAERAELLLSPDYPSAQKIWHHFADEDALVACLGSAYTDLLEQGARFRARVNHVEQAFSPIVPARATVLARPLASTGAWMPLVGYGTAVFRGREREGTLPLADAVRIALRAGVRLLDCSPDYGTQAEVGAALTAALREGEVVHRSKLFVVSSISAVVIERVAPAATRADAREVAEALRADVARTLAELGLEYLDALVLPYQPFASLNLGDDAIAAVWRALETLVGPQGAVRHLGVAGFPLDALAALDQDPSVARRPDLCLTELHPFYRDEVLVAYCENRGGTAAAAGGPIQVVAHSPLGRPAKSRPPGTCILREPLIELSAEALEVTPAQVVLRWAVQQGAAVVPNSLSRRHVLANACLHPFIMATFRVDVLNEMSAVRALRFADPARPPAAPPAPLERVAAEGLVFQDDGTAVPPGSDYEYLELTVEVFDRLDLGDAGELLVEPRQIAGAFPGMDVEPIEE